MLKDKIRKSVGILTMACFLATPIGYVISTSTTEAAPPPPPPRHRMAPPPPPHHKAPGWKKHHHLHSIDGKMIIEDQMHHRHHLDLIVIDNKIKPLTKYSQRFLFAVLI